MDPLNPLPKRISFVALRLRMGIRVLVGGGCRAWILCLLDPIRRGLPPLAKPQRIVAKEDAPMALMDPFEQQLDDSRAAAELTAA